MVGVKYAAMERKSKVVDNLVIFFIRIYVTRLIIGKIISQISFLNNETFLSFIREALNVFARRPILYTASTKLLYSALERDEVSFERKSGFGPQLHCAFCFGYRLGEGSMQGLLTIKTFQFTVSCFRLLCFIDSPAPFYLILLCLPPR